MSDPRITRNEILDGYSNFDCVEPAKAEERLKNENAWLAHPAWDHWGVMWFENGQFHEFVLQYYQHVDTISGPTLRDVFEAVNEKWGWK